ncbi:MAG: hypothetical protein GY845_32410 [Planctomycetes bacterium]|nr:hypothetical protein [Planctomycetota bacterium]
MKHKDVVYYDIQYDNSFNCVKPLAFTDNWSGNFLFTVGPVRTARGLEDILDALKHLDAGKFHINLLIAGATISEMKYMD